MAKSLNTLYHLYYFVKIEKAGEGIYTRRMLEKSDRGWLVGLVAVGILTHGLWLARPNEVVFDEVHFGKFVTAYCCTHERIFDIHPPHAKLLIAGMAYLFGYRGGFDFDHISEPYGAVSAVALRLLPALAGIALPLVLYGLMRQLKASALAAGVVGMWLALDNALIVQSRLLALDSVLLLATFGALSAFLAAGTSKGWSWITWSLLAGALAGLAVGTKFTGMAIVGLIGLLALIQWRNRFLARVGFMVVAFGLVYLGGWVVHFLTLTQPGPGDAWRVSVWDGFLPVAFIRETIVWHKLMLQANYNLTATHPFASPWWSWPLMLKPVFYWQGTAERAIYFLGNPVVWWGSTLLFLGALFSGVWQRRLAAGMGITLTGFVLALVPFIRIPRALFMYHYLTPLTFGAMFGVLWLDQTKYRSWLAWLLPAVAVGWIMVAPLTYALAVPGWWQGVLNSLV